MQISSFSRKTRFEVNLHKSRAFPSSYSLLRGPSSFPNKSKFPSNFSSSSGSSSDWWARGPKACFPSSCFRKSLYSLLPDSTCSSPSPFSQGKWHSLLLHHPSIRSSSHLWTDKWLNKIQWNINKPSEGKTFPFMLQYRWRHSCLWNKAVTKRQRYLESSKIIVIAGRRGILNSYIQKNGELEFSGWRVFIFVR